MSYQQILVEDDLEAHLKTRLDTAIEKAKFSILNASAGAVQQDELNKKICDEFRVWPINFLQSEMTTGVAKVTKQDQIQIEFLVPFEGDACAILKHCDHAIYQRTPKAVYIPQITDIKTGHIKEKNCISFFVTLDKGSTGAEFTREAQSTLRNLLSILQPNINAVRDFNDGQLPHCVRNAMELAMVARQRLDETEAYLNSLQK